MALGFLAVNTAFDAQRISNRLWSIILLELPVSPRHIFVDNLLFFGLNLIAGTFDKFPGSVQVLLARISAPILDNCILLFLRPEPLGSLCSQVIRNNFLQAFVPAEPPVTLLTLHSLLLQVFLKARSDWRKFVLYFDGPGRLLESVTI